MAATRKKSKKQGGSYGLSCSQILAICAILAVAVAVLYKPATTVTNVKPASKHSGNAAQNQQQQQKQPTLSTRPSPESDSLRYKLYPPAPDATAPFKMHPKVVFDVSAEDMNKPVPGALSKIIAPFSLVNYFHQYFDKHPFLLKRTQAFYDGLNSCLANADLLLQIHSVTSQNETFLSPTTGKTQANCAFVKEGMEGLNDKYSSVYEAYLDGCTVVCNIVAAYWQPLAGLMDGIHFETALPYMANMYLTPRNSQGFVEHTDNKNGLIVQTGGQKEWVVKDTKFPAPMRTQMVGRPFETPVAAVVDDLVLQDVIRQGDVLFVPRGMPHYAKSVGDHPSLHFTLSPTKNLEWADYFVGVLTEGVPFFAAFLEAKAGGEDAFEQDDVYKCASALSEASVASVYEQASHAAEFGIRASMPWWYRALAGATVPSLHSAVDHTLDECIADKTARGASTERVQALKVTLQTELSLDIVLDILKECAPATHDIDPASIALCEKVIDAIEDKTEGDEDIFTNIVRTLTHDHQLMKGILPNVMRKQNVFVDYTTGLFAHGLAQDFSKYRNLSFAVDQPLEFTGKEWSFAASPDANDPEGTAPTADAAASISIVVDGKKKMTLRHSSQLEEQLAFLKQRSSENKPVTTNDVAAHTVPADAFEAACIVRVLSSMGVVTLPPYQEDEGEEQAPEDGGSSDAAAREEQPQVSDEAPEMAAPSTAPSSATASSSSSSSSSSSVATEEAPRASEGTDAQAEAETEAEAEAVEEERATEDDEVESSVGAEEEDVRKMQHAVFKEDPRES